MQFKLHTCLLHFFLINITYDRLSSNSHSFFIIDLIKEVSKHSIKLGNRTNAYSLPTTH